MSWRQDLVSATLTPWGYRLAVMVNVYTSASGTVDVQIVVPATLDHFWDTVVSADDIVVTDSDGVTVLDYQIDDAAFSAAGADLSARDMGVEVDALSVTVSNGQGRPTLIWLYYGLTGAADNQAGSITIASPYAGHVYEGSPGSRQISASPPLPGSATPSQQVSKTEDETTAVWLDVTPVLETRKRPSAGRLNFEELRHIRHEVESLIQPLSVQRAGTDYAAADVRAWYDNETGKTWLRYLVEPNGSVTADNAHTLIFPFVTTEGANHEARALLQVYNPDED